MATAASNTGNEKNLETFSLVWVTNSMNNTQETIDIQRQFRKLINQLKTFEDDEECEQYIRSLSHFDRFILVVSARLVQNLVASIHQLPQVSSIYVHCIDNEANQSWTQQFTKIRGVNVELNKLIGQIRLDQYKRQRYKVGEPLNITIFNAKLAQGHSSTRLNGQFVSSQLLVDHLLRMKSTPADKDELISYCWQHYNRNKNQLAIFREFKEEYSCDRSLRWYTRESFVSQLLNRALREQNIHLLYLFRFLMRDLGQQLKEHQCLSPVTVYRGQLMSKDELEVLKQSVGEVIAMNSFLSTSLDRQLALFFLTDFAFSDDLERVLFEIIADPCLEDVKPFANITSLSYFPDENEILFALGSIFRLDNIHQDKNRVWIIRLALCCENDHDMKVLSDHLTNEYCTGEPDLISFGNLLRDMNKIDEAEKYYYRRLNQLSSNDHRNIAVCYYSLGTVAMERGTYDLSLKWFFASLEIETQTLNPYDPSLAITHNCIGNVYSGKNDYKKAFESYSQALMIYRRTSGEDNTKIATCFNNIGTVYFKEKNYLEALHYYEKSLVLRQKHLPADHYWLGSTYNNIGNVYDLLGHADLAMKQYDLALQIFQKSIASKHSVIAMTLYNIGTVHEKKGELENALSYYEKATTIYHQTLPHTHPYVVKTEKHIQRVLFQLK